MSWIERRIPRRSQPQGAVRLALPASFIWTPGGAMTPTLTDAGIALAPYGGGQAIFLGGSTTARASFDLPSAPPVSGSNPWTLIALQYWASAPSSSYKGIIGLRDGVGPVLLSNDGQLAMYFDAGGFNSSVLSIGAGLHCVAVSHYGNGGGEWYLDGAVSAASGLSNAANPITTVTLMNWDTGGEFSPGAGCYQLFAAILPVYVPPSRLQAATGAKNPWLLFADIARRVPMLNAAPAGVPDITALLAESILSDRVNYRATLNYA